MSKQNKCSKLIQTNRIIQTECKQAAQARQQTAKLSKQEQMQQGCPNKQKAQNRAKQAAKWQATNSKNEAAS